MKALAQNTNLACCHFSRRSGWERENVRLSRIWGLDTVFASGFRCFDVTAKEQIWGFARSLDQSDTWGSRAASQDGTTQFVSSAEGEGYLVFLNCASHG